MKKLAWMGMLVLLLGGCANMDAGPNRYGFWPQMEPIGGPFSEFGFDADDMGFEDPFDPFGRCDPE